MFIDLEISTMIWAAVALIACICGPMMYHDHTGRWPWQDHGEDDK